MRKFRLLTMLMVVISLLASSMSCYAASAFTDIKDTNWAYTYVNELVKRGGINGYNDGTFKPNNTITNAEFIKTLIGTTVGEQKKTTAHWASGYIDKAIELGILENNELEKSSYNKAMTREMMATTVSRIAEKILKENITCENRSVVANSIKDYDRIQSNYKNSVIDVYYSGIINGYSDGTFKPINTATRAEACTMIVRLINHEQRKSYEPTETVKEVPINTMIKNIEYDQDLKTINTCIVDNDSSKYQMQLYTNPVNGKVSVIAKNLYTTIYFIKDGKIVGHDNIMTDIDGNCGFAYKGDIQTIDYIGSLDAYTNIVTLVVNPFKTK